MIVTIYNNPVHAGISNRFDKGAIYSGSSFPLDVSKNDNYSMPEINGLKSGEATTKNILGIIETGNRGIQAAAKNGDISRIYYIDSEVNKVYVPLGFIPIYMKQTKTIVFGE